MLVAQFGFNQEANVLFNSEMLIVSSFSVIRIVKLLIADKRLTNNALKVILDEQVVGG